FIDWNISRQIVWGIRIPAWKCKDCNKWTVEKIKPEKCSNCKLTNLIQDTDTFDTWFSSSQWPFATLMTQGKDFYEYFYPTSVMETGYDLLRGWVARMIMIGYFVTKKQQFNLVYLHGMVRDGKGQKMSKSKGNVIDPVEKVDKYGADAVRASLIFNIKEGADISLSDAKIQGMRNFANKVWNIGRFLHIVSSPRKRGSGDNQIPDQVGNDKEAVGKDKLLDELEEEFEIVKKSYFNNMDSYKFSFAFDAVYEFLWHRFADYYIEVLKDEVINGNIKAKELLFNIYRENLKLLHPFIPFVTEAVWKEFHGRYKSILSERY
ncbi:MAG: class I tRNA ligase family protein, partial [Nanoarchaeota archaeon]